MSGSLYLVNTKHYCIVKAFLLSTPFPFAIFKCSVVFQIREDSMAYSPSPSHTTPVRAAINATILAPGAMTVPALFEAVTLLDG